MTVPSTIVPSLPGEIVDPADKATYCRDKAAELFAAADRSIAAQARQDCVTVAEQWSALALHFEKQAARVRERRSA